MFDLQNKASKSCVWKIELPLFAKFVGQTNQSWRFTEEKHRSCVLGRESWVLGPGSWVLGPASWVLGPGSWVLRPASKGSVLGSGSLVLSPGTWDLSPLSCVQDFFPESWFWCLGPGFCVSEEQG